MIGLIEITEDIRDSGRRMKHSDECSFLEWKFGQIKSIKHVAEIAETPQEIAVLKEAMITYSSQDFIERFPKLHAYELGVYRYLCERQQELRNNSVCL